MLRLKYIIVFISLLTYQRGLSQEKLINYRSTDKQLSSVLDEISANYEVKFAYDPQTFSNIKVTINLKNSTIDEFLDFLKSKYDVNSRLVDKTWILVYTPPKLEPVVSKPATDDKRNILVSGYVRDATTGEYLLYCNVLYNAKQGTMTNQLGFFSFQTDKPEENEIKIMISHLGYQRLDTTVTAGESVNIFLKPARILMEDIVIKQVEKNVIEATPQSGKIGFNPDKLSIFQGLLMMILPTQYW